MENMTIEKVKKGNYFRLKENSPIYVADGYNRTTKKYSTYKFDDISSFREFKNGTVVIVNFEF